MARDDKRKEPRISSSNLIFYVSLDENGQAITQGMGRALNVSEGGILLETHGPIDPHYMVSITIAMEDELMDFKGRIAHSAKRGDGRFTTGVEFIEMNEEKRRHLGQYVILFGGQKPSI
jgi:c-di-GMP-binding flagellar brake protein YcgR